MPVPQGFLRKEVVLKGSFPQKEIIGTIESVGKGIFNIKDKTTQQIIAISITQITDMKVIKE